MRSNGLDRLSDTMSCCLKYYPIKTLKCNDLSFHLECPLLLTECLRVLVNVGLCDVIPVELDICPVVEKVRHPVHIPAGGVQEADLVLAEDPLEMVSHGVEGADHPSGGCPGAAGATLRLQVTPEPPLVSVDFLKTLLPRLIILLFLNDSNATQIRFVTMSRPKIISLKRLEVEFTLFL